MAERLVEDMAGDWKPEQYKDTYTDDLMARIDRRIKAGETHVITAESGGEGAEPRRGAQVIDLVSMLRRSLEQNGKGAKDDEEGGARQERPKRAAARKSPSRVTPRKPAAQRKRA